MVSCFWFHLSGREIGRRSLDIMFPRYGRAKENSTKQWGHQMGTEEQDHFAKVSVQRALFDLHTAYRTCVMVTHFPPS